VHATDHRHLLLALALLASCTTGSQRDAAPLDRLAFPTGVALVDAAAGTDDDRLLVVSSNFDLHFDSGSVLQIDVGAGQTLPSGGVRIGSFGGEIAVAGAPCGFASPVALVPSRSTNRLYQVALEGGEVTCGDGCETSLEVEGASDPYGVGLSCPASGTPRAWIGHLEGVDDDGFLTVMNLSADPAAREPRLLGLGTAGAPRSFAYDAVQDRLYFTSTESGLSAPLRWIDLAGGCTPGDEEQEGGCHLDTFDLFSLIRGAELAGIALSNPQDGLVRRAYVAVKVYDADLASSLGARPGFDIGGLLVVLDLAEGNVGEPRPRLVRTLEIGVGASEVRVLPARPGRRDLVAVTATEDGVLWIYDDEAGAMAKVFGRDPTTGAPLLGHLPFGIAVQDRGPELARLFVGSFEDGFVTTVDVPLDDPAGAALIRSDEGAVVRLGEVSP
jgi:hypothetical protein